MSLLGHIAFLSMAFLTGFGQGSDGPGDVVATALSRERAALHRCWEMAAADDLHVEGTLVVKVALDASGKVKSSAVVSDGPGDPVLTTCVLERAKRLRLPGLGVDEVEIPFDFVAPARQATVRASDVVEAPFADGAKARQLITAKNVGATDVTLASLTLWHGVPMTFGGTAIVVVLSGALHLPDGGVVTKGGALYVGDTITVRTKAITTALVLIVPSGRATGARHANRTDRPVYPIAGGKGAVTILFDAALAGDPTAYAGHLVAKAGMAAPLHTHDTSSEILYVVKGAGTMTIAGESVPVEAGMAVYIPKATVHSFTAGPKGLEAIQFYAPAGPEQRFKGPPK